MAKNPSVNIGFQDGGLQGPINTADEVALKIGVSTGGPYLRPVRASSVDDVLRFKHGPLVRSSAHHADKSSPFYMMRVRASVPGSIGSVTKAPATTGPLSLGSLSLALPTFTLHATAAAGAALNLTTGWSAPDAPLPLKITSGMGTVAHTQTVTGVDAAGDPVVETVSISGAGDVTTTTEWQKIVKVVSNIDPNGTSAYTAAFASPGDRYDAKIDFPTGGVLGVVGGKTPTYRLSIDGGRTFSRAYQMPSNGVVDLYTYAGGRTPQALGIRATFAAGSLAQSLYGAIKIAGATTDGDMVFNLKSSGVTVTVVVAGMGTVFSVSVTASAITINSATDAMTGAATTKGQEVIDYILTSSDTNAVKARALVQPTISGTGQGLVAAAASTGAPNGGLAATPLVEGVSFRVVNGGASKVHSIGVVGKAVTLYADTDSKGVQTTTANQAVGYIAADPVASTLLSLAAGGTGAGIVGCLTSYTVLPVSIATGDSYTFQTTPPAWSESDLQEGLNALLANKKWLAYASVIHVIGDISDTGNIVVGNFIGAAAAQKKQFKLAVTEATYQGATSETTWANALISAYTTRNTSIGIAAGEANVYNPAYNTIDRVNAGTPYVARLMICPISELPSHVDCETLLGTKNALDGVQERQGETDQPLWQSEDTLVTLNTNNFITLCTHAGRSGIYVRQGLNFVDDGSDYTYVTNRRIANVAAALTYDEILRFLSASMLLDPKSGQLAEAECQKLESQVGKRLRTKLVSNDRGRQHTAGVAFNVVRGEDFYATEQVNGTVTIVPRIPATEFNVKIGFSPVLSDTSAAAS